MGWKPEVKVTGEEKWHQNGLTFATKKEADASARDLFTRWTACTDYNSSEVAEKANYQRVEGRDVPLALVEKEGGP